MTHHHRQKGTTDVRRHAKASSAASTPGRGSRLDSTVRGAFDTRGASRDADGSGAPSHSRGRVAALLLAIAALALLAFAPSASAAARLYKSSFGTFSGSDPQALTVDQSNGDIYAVDTTNNTIHRYNSTGAAKNFTCGTCSGNTLTGFSFDAGPGAVEVAIDRSGGPANGDIYVADGYNGVAGTIDVFSNSGAPLGTLDGSGTPNHGYTEPCGVAVDQSNGDVYVGDYSGNVWRYSAAATPAESNYSGGIMTDTTPCGVAADNGNVYAGDTYAGGTVIEQYSASDFALGTPPSPTPTVIDSASSSVHPGALATDPSTGDLYVDEGSRIHVFHSNGASAYSFGSGDFGNGGLASWSAGIAVMGSGGDAYVADPSTHTIRVYPLVTRLYKSSFGTFSGSDPQALTVDQSNGDIYAVDTTNNTIHRYNSTGAAKNFTCGTCSGNTLTGFSFDAGPGAVEVAIDRSGGPANGDIYVADGYNGVAGTIDVFSNSGAPLGTLDGSGTPNHGYTEPCGVAVDQSNGDVYVGDYSGNVWRYSAAATPAESNYSGGIMTDTTPCGVAADNGNVYAGDTYAGGTVIEQYSASDFALGTPPSPTPTVIDSASSSVHPGALATDPSTGDLYVDEGSRIHVFHSNGASAYSFGSGDFGNGGLASWSAGIAVMGSGGDAYVADPSTHTIRVYPLVTRLYKSSFGTFSGSDPQALTVDQSNGDIYAVDTTNNTIHRYNSTGAAKNFTCGTCSGNTLTGFSFDAGPGAVEVAIDRSGGPANGDIYVADGYNGVAGTIDVFSNSGAPLGTLDGSGTPNHGYTEPCGVAVDQSNGDVYVGDYSGNVWRYSAAATPAESNYSGGIMTDTTPCGVAADNGNVYAGDTYAGGTVIEQYSASDFALGTPPSPTPTVIDSASSSVHPGALATDPSTGDLYVDEGSRIHVFHSNGASAYSFGSGDFGNGGLASWSAGIAVMGSGGDAYVADPSTHTIRDYGPFVGTSTTPPAASTQPATPVGLGTATLNAKVNPHAGQLSDCHFEYTDDADFQANAWTNAQTAPCSPDPGASSTNVDVHADLTGLSTGTTYDFRVVAANDGGSASGTPLTFATIPVAFTDAPTGTDHHTDATLHGHIDPHGDHITACRFDWGTDTNYGGAPVPCAEGGSFTDPAGVSAFLSHLSPGTPIHYRLHLTTTEDGEALGADRVFTPTPSLVHNLTTIGSAGSGADQLSTSAPRVAVDQQTGSVYVADAGNARVARYDANGNFLRAWGWDVVASGPDNQTGSDEIQQVSLNNATGGTFQLLFQVGAGTGKVAGGSATITDVNTTSGAFSVGELISDISSKSLIPSGTTITAVGAGQLTLSAPINAGSGYTSTDGLVASNATAPIAYDAAPGDVQTALEGLPGFSSGDVVVTGSTGGPWTVEFTGTKGHLNLPQMTSDDSGLTPRPGAYNVVNTTQEGGAFEVCVPASGDACQAGSPATSAGGFTTPRDIAVDNSGGASQGDVYVFDGSGNHGITKFTPSGSLVTGWASGGRLTVSGTPRAVAVDSAARVVVYSDGQPGYLRRFTGTTGALIDSFPAASNGGASGVGAIAPQAGNVYFEADGQGAAQRYDTAAPPPTYIAKFGAGGGIALDPASGDLYADAGTSIRRYHFDASGNVVQPDLSACVPVADPFLNNPDRGCGFTDSYGAGDLTAAQGLAINGTAGKTYVTDSGQLKIFTAVVLTPPTVRIGDPSDLGATSVTLNAKVDPEDHQVTDCHFSYVDDATYQANGYTNATDVPCAQDPGSGSGDVAVSADVSGLDPATVYHFRIQAENATAQSTVTSSDRTLTTRGPIVSDTHANPVTATTASLDAGVNPQGTATTYHFDYGPTNSYGSSTQESTALGGNVAQPVSQQIGGLTPGQTYHFRIVATNSEATVRGPDATFTTDAQTDNCPNAAMRGGFGAHLPDCRAYEQASPVDKHGAQALTSEQFSAAAVDGSGVTFASAAGVSVPAGDGSRYPVLARRTAAGWTTHSLLAPTTPGSYPYLAGLSPDFSASFSLDAATNLFVGDVSADTWSKQFSSAGTPRFDGFSADPAHTLFDSEAPLAFGAINGDDNHRNLYDYDYGNGTLRLADRVPAAPATSCNDQGAHPCVAPAHGAARLLAVPNQISADGSKIFFQDYDSRNLYMRVGGNRTVQINAPAAGAPADPHGHKPAVLEAVSKTGSLVYFTSCEKLTTDSTSTSTAAVSCTDVSGGQPLQTSDLYRYDTATGQLTDLSVDNADAKGAAVATTLGASADGSYVYFAARASLAAGAPAGDCVTGSPGGPGLHPNLRQGSGSCDVYVSHDGGPPAYVASLPIAELPVGASPDGNYSEWRSVVADDGTIAFESPARLTAYDNSSPACLNSPGSDGNRCRELYRYRPGAPAITCVSCDPSGAPPTGPEATTPDDGNTGWVQPSLSGRDSIYIRSVSNDGNRVFFQTPDKLVAADTNGDQGCPVTVAGPRSCSDPYEWEANGTGSCHSADQDGGCLYLLSSGTSPDPSYIVGASASGNDVFIRTADRFVPQDTDNLYDVYDVRVDGGLASQHQAGAPPCGSAEQCHGQGTTPPSGPGAGSGAIQSQGNPPLPPCRAGKVKRHGRCVARHKKKKHHRKRHHKAKHHKRHHARSHKRANSNRGGSQ